MGIFFSKTASKNKIIHCHYENEPTNSILSKKKDLTKIIEQYEYIKETKCVRDIDKILDIIRNTDWDNNTEWLEKEYSVFPSAPIQENTYPKSIDILAKSTPNELPIAVPIS